MTKISILTAAYNANIETCRGASPEPVRRGAHEVGELVTEGRLRRQEAVDFELIVFRLESEYSHAKNGKIRSC